MVSASEKFDKALEAENRKQFADIMLALVFAGGLSILCVAAYLSGPTKQVFATVKTISSEAQLDEEHFHIVVEMQPGWSRRIETPREAAVRVGSRVILHERSTRLFNLKSYTFLKVSEF